MESNSNSMEGRCVHLVFEVHGKVQGVYFRKFTVRKATELGLKGWVMNAPEKTKVVGEAQGPQSAIDVFKHWLRHEGSPKSRVDRLVSRERPCNQPTYPDFQVHGGRE